MGDTLNNVSDWARNGGNSALADALDAYIAGGCQGNFTWTANNDTNNSGKTGSTGNTGSTGSSNGSSAAYDGWSSSGNTNGSDYWNSITGNNPPPAGGYNWGCGGGYGGYNNPYDPYGGTTCGTGYTYGGRYYN